jgi:hypothetical protein
MYLLCESTFQRNVSPLAGGCSQLVMLVPRVWILYHEVGGDMFLQNIDSHKIYVAPHPRRLHSSGLLKFVGLVP